MPNEDVSLKGCFTLKNKTTVLRRIRVFMSWFVFAKEQ